LCPQISPESEFTAEFAEDAEGEEEMIREFNTKRRGQNEKMGLRFR